VQFRLDNDSIAILIGYAPLKYTLEVTKSELLNLKRTHADGFNVRGRLMWSGLSQGSSGGSNSSSKLTWLLKSACDPFLKAAGETNHTPMGLREDRAERASARAEQQLDGAQRASVCLCSTFHTTVVVSVNACACVCDRQKEILQTRHWRARLKQPKWILCCMLASLPGTTANYLALVYHVFRGGNLL